MIAIFRNGQVFLSAAVILLLIVMAILAPVLSPYDPTAMSGGARFSPPTAAHPLGGDYLGRDILSNILFGARTTLIVSITSVLIAATAGMALGVTAGYFRGRIEALTMRTIDLILSFPPILVVIFIVGFIGPSLSNLILVIGLLYTPRFARVAYGSALSTSERPFVMSAIALGASPLRILTLHILPNTFAPLFIQFSLSLGQAILLESSLSFLGLGPPPPLPSWGRLINESRRFIQMGVNGIIWPAVVISITVLAFNLLGDGLRDKLDPRLRGRL